MDRRMSWSLRRVCGVSVVLATLAAGCATEMTVGDGAADGRSNDTGGVRDVIPIDTGPRDGSDTDGAVVPVTDQVDFLLMVDNSNSMQQNQAQIMAQLGALIAGLTNPPCVSRTNTTPHACSATDPTDRPLFPAVRDMHVGVISSDLGTAGIVVNGCANPSGGDEGLLNPIHFGPALAMHRPTPGSPTAAPAGFRPPECMDPAQFPAFISFRSGTTSPATFDRDFRCNAGLYVNGCGLEQPLEAVRRALIEHDARERAGNTDPNAGFVRDGAVLAIVLLTDEEDMSVRDCTHAGGSPCTDARGVFDVASSAWSSPVLNLRAYLYRAGSAQDPTWPLERYVNPRDANAGWLSLKPGHPERIVFAAITGVPLRLSTTDRGVTDWDALLGPAGADRDDYNARNALGAVSEMSREGLVSMRQPNLDPRCSDRAVPACRREGQLDDPMRPACVNTEQYFAWPARRIVEVARRFDQSNLCSGTPCNNGMVCSICASSFSACVLNLAERVGRRLLPPG